jgi:hypothetical protein
MIRGKTGEIECLYEVLEKGSPSAIGVSSKVECHGICPDIRLENLLLLNSPVIP